MRGVSPCEWDVRCSVTEGIRTWKRLSAAQRGDGAGRQRALTLQTIRRPLPWGGLRLLAWRVAT